ncbi:MAG: hypothetical protein ABII21_01515 [bacterium]
MTTSPLGWQSWSPPTPNLLRLPRRDHCPLPELSHPILPRTQKPKPPITYWCSWYALGRNINPHNLLTQAKLIKQHALPISHFLIDDGWTFSPWLKPLITELHSLEFKVGLWYTPFTRHKHLSLYPTLDLLIQQY